MKGTEALSRSLISNDYASRSVASACGIGERYLDINVPVSPQHDAMSLIEDEVNYPLTLLILMIT